jgi:N-methylhydantoinase A
MLTCDLRQDYVQTLVRDYAAVSADEVQAALTTLLNDGLAVLSPEQTGPDNGATVDCRLDLRYRGQEYTVAVPLEGTSFTSAEREPVAARFHELHGLLYGHAAPEEPLELVGVRVTVHRTVDKGRSAANSPVLVDDRPKPVSAYAQRRVYMGERHGFLETPVYRRSDLSPGAKFVGPAIVEETASTTVVLPGDNVRVAASGELVIRIACEET